MCESQRRKHHLVVVLFVFPSSWTFDPGFSARLEYQAENCATFVLPHVAFLGDSNQREQRMQRQQEHSELLIPSYSFSPHFCENPNHFFCISTMLMFAGDIS
jgi:hypothetical protein